MRQALRLHPSSRCGAAIEVEAEAARSRTGILQLTYVVTGAIGGLYLPPAGHPARADELWRRTCFEAFVRPGPGEAYFEFNFAPSRQWAAYRFDFYRAGMRAADEIAATDIEAHIGGGRFELTVTLDLPDWPAHRPWRLGLTAVIEELNGDKSYWALAHAPGRPDFHYADGFALEL
jgi:hypothetical protein